MNDPPENSLKECVKCYGSFPLNSFYKDNKRNAFFSSCKECRKQYSKAYYVQHSERIKKYRKTRQDETTLSSIKRRAKRKGLDFDLDVEDVKGNVCPVFGVELIRVSTPGAADFSPSVDRIDNSKGYVKGNVQVLSNLANKMKANATKEQLIQFAEWVLKTYK